MFRLAIFLGLVGLAAASAVIVWSGWQQVALALQQTGWGVVAIALFHFLPLTVASIGWVALVPGKRKPSLLLFLYFMWIRASINNLMPVARVGGEIATVRVMIAHGIRKSIAICSTIVELTLSVAAIFLFVVIGVILFALRVNNHHVEMQLIWGLVFSLPLLGAMAAVQRIGFFGLLARVMKLLFRDKWQEIAGDHVRLDRAMTLMYRRQGRVLFCGLTQFVAWSLGAVEIWMALVFLKHPLSPLESVMLEALVQASASAAFAVPGALGVQEAGFLVFGGMLGLPHEVSAAMAVIRRCRDLLCYVPGLIAWQTHEGKRLLQR